MVRQLRGQGRYRSQSGGRKQVGVSRNTIFFWLEILNFKENSMAKNKQIQNIAIVGTGVIGASWAAYYLSRGLDVVATDPAPNAEASLRKYVDEAWTLLLSMGLKPGASRDRLAFTTEMKQALSKADLVQE